MVSPASPLGGGSISPMRQQSSIVAASGGSTMVLDLAWRKRSGVGEVGLTRNNGAQTDQGLDELQNQRALEIEILNVDLSRV